MLVLANPSELPAEMRGGVLCVGNFDGVHAGHALMLEAGRDAAQALKPVGGAFVIMTFEPHPSAILRPGVPRPPLTTLEQRVERLGEYSPDVVIVVPTTREFLAISPEDFLRQVRETLGTRQVVEGKNFTFGRGAKGTVETLQQSAREFGFGVTIVPTVTRVLSDMTQVNVSSSLIRWLIGQGRVADAGRCLGRPYTLRGAVVEGQRRGRALGFPTANLHTTQLLPAPGVYAGMASVGSAADAQARAFAAAVSIGTNPTFEGQQTTVEAHLLDFAGDLYGQTMDLALVRWMRDLEKYSGVEPLVRQLRRDVAATRAATTARTTKAPRHQGRD